MPLPELAARQGLIIPDNHNRLKSDIEEIARMLSGLINGLDNRGSPGPDEVSSGAGRSVKDRVPR